MYLASRHQVRAITNMMDDKWHDYVFGVNQSAVINVGFGTPCLMHNTGQATAIVSLALWSKNIDYYGQMHGRIWHEAGRDYRTSSLT